MSYEQIHTQDAFHSQIRITHFVSETSKYAKLNEVEPAPTPRKRIMHFAKHTEYRHAKYTSEQICQAYEF